MLFQFLSTLRHAVCPLRFGSLHDGLLLLRGRHCRWTTPYHGTLRTWRGTSTTTPPLVSQALQPWCDASAPHLPARSAFW